MKLPTLDLLPPLLVALGLFGSISVFILETHSFRDAVFSWAHRDLESRTELAASTLKDAVETGDFRRIHEFGESCSVDGVRLTVLSAPGGIVFDSVGRQSNQEKSIFATRPCGEFRVRLGLPISRVLAPYHRARVGFMLAGMVGGVGVLFIILFTFRQRVRMRELARERDAQRKLVTELQKVEALRRDFIADVSHEIKTPLTGIIGAVDLLSSAGDLPSESRNRLFSMLKSESDRLNNLAQGIISLARLERSTVSDFANLVHADLSAIVREVVDSLLVQAESKNISVKLNVPETCTVECDEQLISSAISNLLLNAIRYSESKDILVELSLSDNSVSIVVEDYGIGIPPECRERVFDRFYRVDHSRNSSTGGTGLGLAIVRSIAHLHRGEVTLEGANPSGCRFTFTFPAKM